MPLEPALWFEKAERAMQTAQTLADAGDLLGASSRGYYSIYSHLTGILIHLGYQPPGRGNWSHGVLPRVARDGFKPSFQKKLALSLLDKLKDHRVLADYDDHRSIKADDVYGDLRQLRTVLEWDWRGR